MKAMNFGDDITSMPIDRFKDHYVLSFDLTSMQDATEQCHYPELVGEPLRLELNITFALDHVTEVFVLGLQKQSISSVLLEKTFNMDNVSLLEKKIDRIPLLKYRYIGSPPCDLAPNLPNFTFAIINTQPSKMQVEHRIMTAKLHHQLFADSLGRKYSPMVDRSFHVIQISGINSELFSACFNFR